MRERGVHCRSKMANLPTRFTQRCGHFTGPGCNAASIPYGTAHVSQAEGVTYCCSNNEQVPQFVPNITSVFYPILSIPGCSPNHTHQLQHRQPHYGIAISAALVIIDPSYHQPWTGPMAGFQNTGVPRVAWPCGSRWTGARRDSRPSKPTKATCLRNISMTRQRRTTITDAS